MALKDPVGANPVLGPLDMTSSVYSDRRAGAMLGADELGGRNGNGLACWWR